MKTLKRKKKKVAKGFRVLNAAELLQIKGGKDGSATLKDGIIH